MDQKYLNLENTLQYTIERSNALSGHPAHQLQPALAPDNLIKSWQKAIRRSNTEEVSKLAHSLYKFQKVRQSKTKSVFLIAALTGDIKLIEKIFQGEIDKNPMGARNCTPLHYVAAEGDFLVCKWIIENVQNKNPKNIIGWTPLHNAAANGHLEVCQLIMENITENKTKQINLNFIFLFCLFFDKKLSFTLSNVYTQE